MLNFLQFFFLLLFPAQRILTELLKVGLPCMRHLLCPVSHPFSPPFLQTLLWKPAANRCTWSDSATNLSLFDHSTDVVETCLASASQQPGYAKESALLTNGEQVWVNAVFYCAGGQFWSKFCKASPRVLMEGSPSCPQGDRQEKHLFFFALAWTLPMVHSPRPPLLFLGITS